MDSVALTYLLGFSVCLIVSFYVLLSARENLLNRIFSAVGLAAALFLFLVFKQVRSLSLGEGMGLTGTAGKALFIVQVVLAIFFAAVFIERSRTVAKSLVKAAYHKGYIVGGASLLTYAAVVCVPTEAPHPELSCRCMSGAFATALGFVLLGRAVLHFGRFRISLGNTAEKIASEMDEALFLLTPELRFAWCNPAAELLTGERMNALLGRSIDERLFFGREKAGTRWLHSGPREGELQNSSGDRMSVSVNTATLENNRRQTIGYVVIVRNLTMRQRRIEEIRRHRDELAELVNLKTRELHNSHLSLKKSKAQLSYLNKIMIEVKEQEGMHIARELTNKIVPALTEILGQAKRFEQTADRNMTEYDYALNKARKIADLAEAAVQSVARISAGLPPSDLESGDLVSALSGLVAEFRARSGIVCQFHHDGVDQVSRVKEDMSIVVYRIVQESLTNAARHAGGDRIRVTLRQDGDAIAIDVADNGRGMAPEKMNTLLSTGLRGMKERAKSVRGTLDIESAPGKGTTVRFRASLTAPAVLLP